MGRSRSIQPPRLEHSSTSPPNARPGGEKSAACSCTAILVLEQKLAVTSGRTQPQHARFEGAITPAVRRIGAVVAQGADLTIQHSAILKFFCSTASMKVGTVQGLSIVP